MAAKLRGTYAATEMEMVTQTAPAAQVFIASQATIPDSGDAANSLDRISIPGIPVERAILWEGTEAGKNNDKPDPCP